MSIYNINNVLKEDISLQDIVDNNDLIELISLGNTSWIPAGKTTEVSIPQEAFYTNLSPEWAQNPKFIQQYNIN